MTSSAGSTFSSVALPLVAVGYLGANGTETGLLAAAGSIGLLLFGLPIGSFVDRLRRKRPLLIAGDLIAALALAALAALLATGTGRALGITALVAFAMTIGVLGLFVEAAYFTHLRSVVPGDGLVPARARLQAGEYAGGVLGRVLVGPATALAGVAAPFLIDAATYLVSAGTLLLIRSRETVRDRRSPAETETAGPRGGLTALGHDPFTRSLIGYLLLSAAVSGMTGALTAPFLLRVLHIPALWYGSLFLLVGIAGTAGSVLAGRLSKRLTATRLCVLGFGCASGTAVLLPLAAGPLWSAAAVAAIAIALPTFFGALSNAGFTAHVTTQVPVDLLGRAVIALHMCSAVATTAGALAAGALADLIGTRTCLWAVAVISTGAVALLIPARRHAQSPVPAQEVRA
ncbi:MFS transporter [Amycolatopsis sp. PS_44_ISF1]|uniref:MFS transporter n=1 Tax=Amycolatopsis sp. PS_44_ISF1 TaxID=2974917 RepID=UPI0037C067DD